MNRKLMTVLTFIGIYFLVAGGSWGVFSYLKKGPDSTSTGSTEKKIADGRRKIDTNAPKTEICPVNGEKFTKAEREIWEKRRPVTAMIENHLEARPLSGVSRADVVYEAIAEGGITRLMGVFYCAAASQEMEISVIRSARVYYINWALEYGDKPIFLHWGGANNICDNCPGGVKPKGQIDPRVDAYALLTKVGWFGGTAGNDFNAGYNIGVPAVIKVRDRLQKGVAAKSEHQPVAYLDEVYKEAEKRGFSFKDTEGKPWNESFIGWEFVDGKPTTSAKASKISFEFEEGYTDYGVTWDYDSGRNLYKRSNGGTPFVDWFFDKEQITASNVIIQFVKSYGEVDKEHHMYFDVTGSGKALIFQNGDVVEGTWSKKTSTDRTVFYDSDKEEVKLVRGQIWIEAVPNGNKITY